MTHPESVSDGATMVLTTGPADRFASPKQVGSYFGLIPSEAASGGKRRAGRDQQTGRFVSALFAGGSRTDGGALIRC